MENTIIGVIGAAAGVVGLVMFVRTLIFRLGGAEAVGRVVSARQDSKGRYIHKVSGASCRRVRTARAGISTR